MIDRYYVDTIRFEYNYPKALSLSFTHTVFFFFLGNEYELCNLDWLFLDVNLAGSYNCYRLYTEYLYSVQTFLLSLFSRKRDCVIAVYNP